MRLWLVRHARPRVPEGLCYGRLNVRADTAHTQDAADALVRELTGQPLVGLLRTSPLQRARQLAGALSERLGLPLETDARLAEMHFGRWEGVPWSDIPKAAVDDWTADFAGHAFGGGESTQQVLERVWLALQEAQAAGRDQLWVTHAGVIRAVQHLRARGAPRIEAASQWPREAPAFGGWVVVDL